MRTFVAAALVGLSLSASLVASAAPVRTWIARELGGPGRPDLASQAWDPVGKRVLLFGGRYGAPGTFGWNGTRWVRAATTGPTGYDVASATDEARGTVVAFGGADADHTTAKIHGTTFVWDGAAWTSPATSTKPSPRRGAAMAWHPIRETVILYGGRDNNGRTFKDTWEWNGTAWTQISSGTDADAPAGLLAFDRKANELILLSKGETRAWDGAAWQVRATGGPTDVAAIGWDPAAGRLVAQGFTEAAGPTTWAWNGTSWAAVTTTGVAAGRPQARELVWDEGTSSLVMYGYAQKPAPDYVFDAEEATYTLAGTTWSRAADVVPTWRTAPGVAYDEARGRLVLFGGARYSAILDDTWEWDGERWQRVTTPTSPSRRRNPSMAWDPSRGAIVLYGGDHEGGSAIGETWTYDGKTWTQLATPTSPPTRSNTALAWDGTGLLLFGGGSGYMNDTWRLSGSEWVQLTPATSPPGRSEHAMAYDSARERVVLYSGRNSSSGSSISDTWEWNGATWRSISAPGAGNRLTHAMVFMPSLHATLLFGASSGAGTPAEWNGLTWESVTIRGEGAPSPRFVELAWDTKRGRAVAVGATGDVWEYVSIGAACTSDTECMSGFCVDGVCCDRACAGGASGDCLACSKQAGGVEDGICGPLADEDAACIPVPDGGIDGDGSVGPGANGAASDGGGGCGCNLAPTSFGGLPLVSVLVAIVARRRSRVCGRTSRVP